jgi:hypothetical protein
MTPDRRRQIHLGSFASRAGGESRLSLSQGGPLDALDWERI